jgi:hypothetical protein
VLLAGIRHQVVLSGALPFRITERITWPIEPALVTRTSRTALACSVRFVLNSASRFAFPAVILAAFDLNAQPLPLHRTEALPPLGTELSASFVIVVLLPATLKDAPSLALTRHCGAGVTASARKLKSTSSSPWTWML